MQKVYFSRLMRVYVGLIMLAACTFSRLLASTRFGTFLQVSALALQAASQSTIINEQLLYTPLVISGNDKIKQPTQLALTKRNTLFAL
jgi:hypothetical protein